MVKAWSASSKRVAGNHKSVLCPGELKGSPQDLIFPLWVGVKDLPVLVVGDDDTLLLVGVLDDHKIIIGKVLDIEQDLFLFKASQDDLVLRLGIGEILLWQENCHIVTFFLENLEGTEQPFGGEVVGKSSRPSHVGSVKHDQPLVPRFGARF